MPKISHTFHLDAPRSKVWKLFTDFERLGPQLPHVVEVNPTIEEGVSQWLLKGSFGPLSKRFTISVHVTGVTPEKSLSFEGVGDGVKLNGLISLGETNEEETDASITLDLDAGEGIVGSIINHVIRTSLQEDTRLSEQKIKELLSTS